VDEFARIATEFKQLAKYGFPRLTHPEVAIAYSFDSFIDSHPNGPSNTTLQYFRPSYTEQVQGAFEPFFRANLDTAIINVGHENLSPYKLVVVPADYVMDLASAKAIRQYVSDGGTVLMTAFSAKVDEHGQWFDTPLPGRLIDVFGLKTNAFYDSTVLRFELDGKSISANSRRYEVLEPSTATALARFANTPDHSPAITINRFGKGNALYLATESNPSTIGPILDRVLRVADIQAGPSTPKGVFARSVDGRTLYVNTTEEKKTVILEGRKRGMLTGRIYEGVLVLGPQESDLVQ
jgi:beta-galactosidase